MKKFSYFEKKSFKNLEKGPGLGKISSIMKKYADSKKITKLKKVHEVEKKFTNVKNVLELEKNSCI